MFTLHISTQTLNFPILQIPKTYHFQCFLNIKYFFFWFYWTASSIKCHVYNIFYLKLSIPKGWSAFYDKKHRKIFYKNKHHCRTLTFCILHFPSELHKTHHRVSTPIWQAIYWFSTSQMIFKSAKLLFVSLDFCVIFFSISYQFCVFLNFRFHLVITSMFFSISFLICLIHFSFCSNIFICVIVYLCFGSNIETSPFFYSLCRKYLSLFTKRPIIDHF